MVSAVTVTGNRVLDTDTVMKTIGFKAGDPWDASRAEDARGKVEKLYQRRGYRGTVWA